LSGKAGFLSSLFNPWPKDVESDETENFSIKGNILDGKISIPIGNREGTRRILLS